MTNKEIAEKINEHLKKIPTKQDKEPYIWDYNIKVRTKEGYDYEEETKVKVKKIEHR